MKKIPRIIALLLALAMMASFAGCVTDKPGMENDNPPIDTTEDVQHYINVNREGTVEKIPVEIVEGVAASYTIAMDPEYFTFSSDGEYDTFTYEDWGGPVNVFYSIFPCYDINAQELAEGLELMYGGDYASCVVEQAAIGMYDAIAVYLDNDRYNEGAQRRFYVIETDYGCLAIECQFTAEMYEGLYAIMRACFDTLTITESKPQENAGATQQTPAQLALAEMQKQIADSGSLVGVAYLGYYDTGLNDAVDSFRNEKFWDKFSFVGELTADRCVLSEGAEWYVIVPAGEDIWITVNEYYFDYEKDYIEGVNPGPGREFISLHDGNAVLLRGNISDIMPNIIVTAEAKDGRFVEYTPCLSLENGKLSNYDGFVFDLTPYDYLPFFGYDQVPDAIFCGTWFCYADDGDGSTYKLILTLNPDGTAEYKYGYPDSEPNETFRGTWTCDDDVITLELTGGPAGYEDFYDNTISFKWDMDYEDPDYDRALVVRHIAITSPFLYADEGAEYWMMPIEDDM